MLLFVLLIFAVVLTISLALLERMLFQTKKTRLYQVSEQLEVATEGGLEIAFVSPPPLGGAAQFQVGEFGVKIERVPAYRGAETYFLPQEIKKDDVGTFWLAEHSDDYTLDPSDTYAGNILTICWSKTGDTAPALLLELLYMDPASASYDVAYGYLEPDPARRYYDSSIEYSADGGFCGRKTAQYRKQLNTIFSFFGIPMTSRLLFLRVKPLFADSVVGIQAETGVGLVSQGYNFVAQSGSPEGEGSTITKKILVFKTYKELPALFDYSFLSE